MRNMCASIKFLLLIARQWAPEQWPGGLGVLLVHASAAPARCNSELLASIDRIAERAQASPELCIDEFLVFFHTAHHHAHRLASNHHRYPLALSPQIAWPSGESAWSGFLESAAPGQTMSRYGLSSLRQNQSNFAVGIGNHAPPIKGSNVISHSEYQLIFL